MGLVKAAAGAIGGTLANQWKDFLTVPANIKPTAALFPAISLGTNAGRGANNKGSNAIITNGSKIVVPEGYGLLIFEEGAITAFTNIPGGYTWYSSDVNSQSVFHRADRSNSLTNQSWEQFKFGGRPGTQQLAIFVSLKELPNNRFGTQSIIYWDDSYLNAQVGALTHGTYSVKIIDPIRFAMQFVPAAYLQAQRTFDFTDRGNAAATQLFSEVIGSLSAAFSSYANDSDMAHRIAQIQRDSVGFATSLSEAVESTYQWESTRGLKITNVTIIGIEYDEDTKALLKAVQRADALAGTRGNANLQASVASGMQAAGDEGGAGGIFGMGVAAGSVGLSSLMQPTPPVEASGIARAVDKDLLTTLESLKSALDAGLIDQAEFDAAKAKALGLQ